MAFPPAFIDELVARNPIEEVVGQYVQLKRRGANYFGLCPFHGEKTPSFSVSPNKQMFYCFGCHKGGGVINFVMDIEGLSYPDAVRQLAQRVNLEVPEDEQYQSRYKEQERLWKLCRDAARFYHNQLKSDLGKDARAYLLNRGLDWATVTKFGIGFAPEGWRNVLPAMERLGYTREELVAANLVTAREKDGKVNAYDRFRNRIMFPLIDIRGNVIGFSGRALDKNDKAKYINPTDTLIFSKRKYLFAMNLAKKTKRDYFILCEGPMDAIACHQFGFDNAVASQGTALTEEQVNMISKYTDRVIMCYDNDRAGQENTRRAIAMFERAGVLVRVLQLHDAKDADEFLHKFGADPFEVLIQGSEGQADFQLQSVKKQFDLTTDEGRVQFSQKAAELISGFPSVVEREIFADKAAKIAGISKEAMLLETEKAYKKRRYREKRQKEKRDLAPAAALQPKDRTLQYANVGSAVAEEYILAMVLADPTLMDLSRELTGAAFSSNLLGRAYDRLAERYREGLTVSLSVLEDFTQTEQSHLASVIEARSGPVDENGYRDCVRKVMTEAMREKQGNSLEELLSLQASMKETKGFGGM